MVDQFREQRLTEPVKKKGATVSPATCNKNLRTVKAVLNKAYRWKYIANIPAFEIAREPKKLPVYMTPEHFALIHKACDNASKPRGMVAYTPAEWWQALLTFAYMTGWRIGEILALEWSDVDFEERTAITRHSDNKGKRDDRIALHPMLVRLLKSMQGTGDERVFPWPHDRRTLDTEFHAIREQAGINLPCHEEHDHTDACHRYGFHDLRRAFATMNSASMSREALKALMRHASEQTTARYVNYAQQVKPAVAKLFVPDVLQGSSS